MLEYEMYNGEYFITFNVVAISENDLTATMAITCAGKISVQEIDLQQDENGLYFEYGPLLEVINIDNFELR